MHRRLDSSKFDIILAERHPGSLQLHSWNNALLFAFETTDKQHQSLSYFAPISNSQRLHQEVKLWSSATNSSIVRRSAGSTARHLCRIAHNPGLMLLGLTRHSWPCSGGDEIIMRQGAEFWTDHQPTLSESSRRFITAAKFASSHITEGDLFPLPSTLSSSSRHIVD